ncbi:hypothetical protein VHUM_02710 [Vanrija humicola]|uniref:Major facilitator superfamily (MFS) profile domain-containing protein n=1 Tax=Vanrija humicola TaxID=5417 RepID=A0A7D8V1R2_VANHU|nr:hypothetical protein VHUM_02710 [Vanrija humicola]
MSVNEKASAELSTKKHRVDDEKKHREDDETFVDTESLVSDITLTAKREGIKPAFLAKVDLLNKAIAEIGMGRYQYELFFSAGFGWFADNIWLQGIAIIMPAVANEWRGYPEVRLATLALYVGLIIGATFWGCSCDIIGRRIAWNCTLVIGGVFGIAAGATNNFTAFAAMIACCGFGVGGNMPVDGTMFLEFLPGKQQYLLTLLSVWWAIGQVVASLIAWAFLARWGCETPKAGTFCTKESNMGWRYTYYTLGAMMIFLWALRFFVMPVYESPKFLASIGKDAAAVDVIHKIAKRNGKESSLTVQDLERAAAPYLSAEEKGKVETKFSTIELLKNSFEDVSFEHVRALFSTPRLALSTSLITLCYASLGLAYPLYNGFLGTYLAQKYQDIGNMNLSDTYASYTYQAACGIPGSILAAFMVDWSRSGRKLAMASFTLLAGIFLFALTQAKTQVQVNALTSIAAFFENAFYGVLYGYAPELFPTPSRGTGDAICSAASRVTGLFAPIIAVYSKAGLTPNGPVYASAGIFVATAFIMLALPVETRGRTAL